MFPLENGRDAAASNSLASNNKINTPTGHKQKGGFKNNAGNKKNITFYITKSSRSVLSLQYSSKYGRRFDGQDCALTPAPVIPERKSIEHNRFERVVKKEKSNNKHDNGNFNSPVPNINNDTNTAAQIALYNDIDKLESMQNVKYSLV